MSNDYSKPTGPFKVSNVRRMTGWQVIATEGQPNHNGEPVGVVVAQSHNRAFCVRLAQLLNQDEAPHWQDDPEHPVADWQYEVSNGDTRLSYADWAQQRRDDDTSG